LTSVTYQTQSISVPVNYTKCSKAKHVGEVIEAYMVKEEE